jgi:hypothetical protein
VSFFEFTSHFEKFRDNYGNNQFVYVEDINGYRQKIEELTEKGIVPKRPYKIIIGEVVLNSAFLYYLVLPGYGRAHVGAANFFVDLDKNPEFYQIDFRNPVEIRWTDKEEVAFRGYAHEVYVSEKSILFLCYGGTRRLFQGKVSCEFIGTTPEDSVYFLAISAGITAVFDGAAQPSLTNRKFKVVFPVGGLDIPADFKIEQVVFTNNVQNVLPEAIRKSKTIASLPWSAASAFAIVDIDAKSFFDALVRADEIVKRAVDWVQFRTDISLPCITENGKRIMIGYNLSKSFSKCFLIPYGLAIDSKTDGALFYLLTIQSGHKLVFHHNPREFFEPLNSLWEKLALIYSQESGSIQPLYEGLSWLMQTFEVESLVDNLIQLWVAFEFICSNERVPELVSQGSISRTIGSIRSLGLPDTEEEAIIRNVLQINSPPLMAKWKHLLSRLGVSLTEREAKLISKLRKERNKIEHGKKLGEMTVDDIEKFRSILERVLLNKAIQLVNSWYGIPDLSLLFV